MPQPRRKTDSNPEAAWFGFRRATPREKTGLVRAVFASVAPRYDLMNDLMSGGLHRLWKDRLVRMMDPKEGQTILDVAGGTGDIAFRCVKRTQGKARVIVCDINPAMLKEGEARAVDHGLLGAVAVATAKAGAEQAPPRNGGVEWITGDAEDLPLPARSVDTYSIAFGLRNVTHIDKALAEAVRVLKPGGRFFCLEFSLGVAKTIKPLYDRYCLEVLPRLGALVAQDRAAYQYLAESIQQFPAQAALAKRMRAAGLEQVAWLNLTGGIAVIHSGWKL